MLKEFATQILKIAQDSITAGATEILIEIDEEPANDLLTIIIEDNGKKFLKTASPYAVLSTQPIRKPSMDIPFLEQTCSECGGHLTVENASPKAGMRLTAALQYSHAEKPILGDILSVIQCLITSHETANIVYLHRYNGKEYSLSSADILAILEGVPFDTPSVSRWIKENMGVGLARIREK